MPDYVATDRSGVKGKRIGGRSISSASTTMAQRALDGAVEVLGKAGATIVDVALPAGFDQAAVRLGAAVRGRGAIAHEATYPARAGEYGRVLAGLIDVGRGCPAPRSPICSCVARRSPARSTGCWPRSICC